MQLNRKSIHLHPAPPDLLDFWYSQWLERATLQKDEDHY